MAEEWDSVAPLKIDLAEYSAVTNPLGEIVRPLINPYEGPLWHYTSLPAVQGILKSNRMFATDSAFLNDSSELRVALLEMCKQASLRYQRSQTDVNRRLHLVCCGAFNQLLWTIYVISFSVRADDLTQWRLYGSGGSGYALTFDSGGLDLQSGAENLFGEDQPVAEALLLRVSYVTPEDLTTICSTLLDCLETIIAEHPDDVNNAAFQVALLYATALLGPVQKSLDTNLRMKSDS